LAAASRVLKMVSLAGFVVSAVSLINHPLLAPGVATNVDTSVRTDHDRDAGAAPVATVDVAVALKRGWF
jgi:hypothetical protein